MNWIYILWIAVIIFFVGLTIFAFMMANGQEVTTPYNTGNKAVSTEYCGFKEYDNCNYIPQNTKISIDSIQNLDEVFN
jgi:hypothetical protein